MATWLPILHRENKDDGWHVQSPAVRRAIRQLEAISGHANTKSIWLHFPWGQSWRLPLEYVFAIMAQYYEEDVPTGTSDSRGCDAQAHGESPPRP